MIRVHHDAVAWQLKSGGVHGCTTSDGSGMFCTNRQYSGFHSAISHELMAREVDIKHANHAKTPEVKEAKVARGELTGERTFRNHALGSEAHV